MRIGVIISGGEAARWQADALRQVAGGNEFIIYDCTNSRSSKRPIAHGGYYLLNLLSVRNRMTAMVKVPAELQIVGQVRFDAEPDGAWERLPPNLIERIRTDAPAAIVKFGMGLLRVPAECELQCPILSFHHGDPRRFRGRPAGFYELLSGEPVIGQIVQILSNRLDAGQVVAFAETKVHAHSWRQSLMDAFRVSPLLLPTAIGNALEGKSIPIDCTGRNYRLPSNFTSGHFAARLGVAKAKRLAYGVLFEKRWRIAQARAGSSPADLQRLDQRSEWSELEVPKRYTFLADPFFASDGAVLAEAMRSDGRGVIVRLADGRCAQLEIDGGHLSYPFTFSFEGNHYVLPEMAGWSTPIAYELTAAGAGERGALDIEGRPHLLDATLHQGEGVWYLFANRKDEGSGVLRLWFADSPFGHFAEHPASPIRISPAGARMGGGILALDGDLYRPGQDFRGGYGDGLILFRVEELSATAYGEQEAARLRFTGCRGPHTLNMRDGTLVFDYYHDRFAPLAGWRRLKQSRS